MSGLFIKIFQELFGSSAFFQANISLRIVGLTKNRKMSKAKIEFPPLKIIQNTAKKIN